jgi:hypothetical protein
MTLLRDATTRRLHRAGRIPLRRRVVKTLLLDARVPRRLLPEERSRRAVTTRRLQESTLRRPKERIPLPDGSSLLRDGTSHLPEEKTPRLAGRIQGRVARRGEPHPALATEQAPTVLKTSADSIATETTAESLNQRDPATNHAAPRRIETADRIERRIELTANDASIETEITPAFWSRRHNAAIPAADPVLTPVTVLGATETSIAMTPATAQQTACSAVKTASIRDLIVRSGKTAASLLPGIRRGTSSLAPSRDAATKTG